MFSGIHQREVFLFNDILVITKIHSRKKNTVTYGFRQSHLLAGMQVNLFETQFYPYGIQIAQKWDRKIVLMLNARNEHDRSKFVEDLKESIAEMDELEQLRLEGELEKQRMSIGGGGGGGGGGGAAGGVAENRDSGINDPGSLEVPVTATGASAGAVSVAAQHPVAVTPKTMVSTTPLGATSASVMNSNGVVLRRSAINNSLLDLSDTAGEKMTRRGSVGSLDSGMSVSFQSNSVAGSFCIGANGNAVPVNGNATRPGDDLHGGHPHQHLHLHPGGGAMHLSSRQQPQHHAYNTRNHNVQTKRKK